MRAALIVIAVLSACSSVEYRPDVAELANGADVARLEGHLRALTALGPRRAGDAATGLATVQYLEERLHALGLATERETFSMTPTTRLVLLVEPEDDNGEEPEEVPVPGVYFGPITQARVMLGFAERAGVADRLTGYRIVFGASEPVDQINLLATIPGVDPDRVLEISAHHDTVPGTVGANDNTTGVAVLLEVARLLSRHPPPCTVRLCFFAAEETGLHGSHEHIRLLTEAGRLDEVIGLINLDAVGVYTNAEDSQTSPIRIPLVAWPPSTGNFLTILGGHGSADLAHQVEDCGDVYAPDLPVYTLARLGGYFDDARRSDHANYWDEGIPAVFLTDTGEFRSDHYHRPGDDLSILDLQMLQKVAVLTTAAALEVGRR